MIARADPARGSYAAVLVDCDAALLQQAALAAGSWQNVNDVSLRQAHADLERRQEFVCAAVIAVHNGIKFLDGQHRTLALLQRQAPRIVVSSDGYGAKWLIEHCDGAQVWV